MHDTRLILTLCFLLLHSIFCYSQDQEIEQLLEEESEYSDQYELMEFLLELEKNPLDVNSATAEELSQLPWITPTIANNIISYRFEIGTFANIERILLVPNFTPELLEMCKKYITVKNRAADGRLLEISQRSRVSRKLENSVGYQDGNYLGSPNKYYNQIKTTLYQNYTAGFVLEKDGGEQNFNDLALFYILYQTPNKNNKLVIGNYRLEFGQGLVFGNPYGARKSSNPIYPVLKPERSLLGYISVDENASLFGVASQICLKIYQVVIFLSKSKLDASLSSSGTVSSLTTTGYHRTESELQKKDQLEENIWGARLLIFPSNNFNIGTTFYQSYYNKEIENDDLIRNRFAFFGKQNYVFSVDGNINFRQAYLFSEYAQSKNKGYGALIGLNIHHNPLNFLALYRDYAKNFQSEHGNAFSETGDSPQNERGFYFGLQYKIKRNTKLSLYYDIFQQPWRTYFFNMPVEGSDLLVQVEHKIKPRLYFTFRVKNKLKEKLYDSQDQFNRTISAIGVEKRFSMRFQLEYFPVSNLKLRGRIESNRFSFNLNSKGLLLYQDVNYKPTDNLNLYFRLAFFDTQDYDSRVYQFENDLPYVLTNQMLYGKGNRWYFCLVYKLYSVLRVSLKYAVTQYEHVETIGSGNDLIYDDSIQTFSFQLESNF